MPRLFTGIEVPNDVASQLMLMQGGIPGARWIDPENYHITLRFIGDVDDRTADDISEELALIQKPDFTVHLNELGSFGSRKPHSLWAGVEKNHDLMALQADQERALQRIGLPSERRKYCPHVTLARLRGTGYPDVANYLSLHGNCLDLSFPVGHFVLFSARSSIGGGPYIVEADYPLSGLSDSRLDYETSMEAASWAST